MPYVLGVDGGQTATKAVLMDGAGRVLGLGEGGPANHIHEPGGVERVQRSLADAVNAARASAGLTDAPIACAYLGMTGLARDMETICRPVVPAERMVFGHDTLIALYSVTLGEPGVVVIAGTGSAAFGRDASGRTAAVGGWGYLMGDEGSGYWTATRALNRCTRALDAGGTGGPLLRRVLEEGRARSLRELHGRIYSGRFTRPDIAALSPAVTLAAEDGDRTAQAILRCAGRELGRQAVLVLRRLGWLDADVPVGTVGGLFRAGRWVLGPFEARVHLAAPRARIVPPKVSAAEAAGLLALEHLRLSQAGV